MRNLYDPVQSVMNEIHESIATCKKHELPLIGIELTTEEWPHFIAGLRKEKIDYHSGQEVINYRGIKFTSPKFRHETQP